MNRKRFQILLMVFVGAPIVSIGLLAATGTFHEKQLKVYGEVPAFSLIERTGEPVSKDTLKQKVWVASFVFTHCAGQCPIIIEQVKKVQKALRFKENFRLVSITVDPENDTPDVLKDYAKKADADPFKWYFLTGKNSEIQSLVQKGFKLSSFNDGSESSSDVTHSEKLVLVDGFGRIRGYYDANESSEVKDLIRDAKVLIRKTF